MHSFMWIQSCQLSRNFNFSTLLERSCDIKLVVSAHYFKIWDTGTSIICSTILFYSRWWLLHCFNVLCKSPESVREVQRIRSCCNITEKLHASLLRIACPARTLQRIQQLRKKTSFISWVSTLAPRCRRMSFISFFVRTRASNLMKWWVSVDHRPAISQVNITSLVRAVRGVIPNRFYPYDGAASFVSLVVWITS